jgi:hypothetical protein
MNNVRELSRYEKQPFNDISTCIISCEKCIYDTNRLDPGMGDLQDSIIIKNLNHIIKDRIRLGRDC